VTWPVGNRLTILTEENPLYAGQKWGLAADFLAFSIKRWLVAIRVRLIHAKVAIREALGIMDALHYQRSHALA
jgi:hypothetical protein